MIWFLRMARWVRNSPSPARLRLVLAVVALVLLLAAVERFVGWPDALTVDRFGSRGG